MSWDIVHVVAAREHPLPSVPRIDPIARDDRSPEQTRLLDQLGGETTLSWTMAHRPDILERCDPLGPPLRLCSDEPREHVRGGRLLLRERELVVLRTARRCGCDYELSQHYPRAATAGLSSDEIERTAEGPDADGWDAFDAALLRAVDELHDEAMVSDATWKVLESRYGKEELIQLVMLIGYYHMLAYFMNSIGIQL